jgi:hypothetical protein
MSLDALVNYKVFSMKELNDVRKLYRGKGNKMNNIKKYEQYKEILSELKKMDYLDEQTYVTKQEILKASLELDS